MTTITRLDIQGNPGVGAFLEANDHFAIAPPGLSPHILHKIQKTFDVPLKQCTLGGSRLLGVYAVGNSQGCAVPFFTSDLELADLQAGLDIPVRRVPGSLTALGNVVLANDHGALVHPGLEAAAIKQLEEILKVKITKGLIALSPLTGSLAVTMANGTLVHPKATEEEIHVLEETLQVPVDIGTVMRGSPYISLGLVANKNGAVTSVLTTGPELARISQTFDFLK